MILNQAQHFRELFMVLPSVEAESPLGLIGGLNDIDHAIVTEISPTQEESRVENIRIFGHRQISIEKALHPSDFDFHAHRVGPLLRIPTQTGHQSDLKSDSVPIQSGQCSD